MNFTGAFRVVAPHEMLKMMLGYKGGGWFCGPPWGTNYSDSLIVAYDTFTKLLLVSDVKRGEGKFALDVPDLRSVARKDSVLTLSRQM